MNITEFYNTYKGKYVDKYGRITSYFQENEPFGGQCVSLVQAFMYKVCGIPVVARGHAKNFGDSLIASKLAKAINTNSLQNGDIIVYPDLGVVKGVTYGHIGIYYNGKVFEQNPHKAELKTKRGGRMWAYRLYKYEELSKPKVLPMPNGFKKFAVVRKYKAKVNMSVRTSPSTSASLLSSNPTFKKGETFTTTGYVDANGYRWFLIQWKGGTIHGYSAEAPLSDIAKGRSVAEDKYFYYDLTLPSGVKEMKLIKFEVRKDIEIKEEPRQNAKTLYYKRKFTKGETFTTKKYIDTDGTRFYVVTWQGGDIIGYVQDDNPLRLVF